MKFVQLAKSLKEEGLAPVYLIEGEEAYFRDRAVAAIREAALTPPSLNAVRYEGEAIKNADLSGILFTLPFFDERRIVRIAEYYPTEKEWEKVLGPYCAAPCATTVLLIVNAGMGSKKTDIKRKKGVTFVDCGREDEPMLSRWVFGMFKRLGITPDGDAVSLLVRFCNYDAARMSLEISKLALLAGEGGRVTRALVEENVARDVEYKIFELTDAVARRNYSDFNVILADLLQKGFDESAALGALTNYFKTLKEVSGMRGSDDAVAAALGMKRYPVQKNREAAAKLGAARVDELYLTCYRLGADMRSGRTSKTGALSAAVAKIFFG